MNTSIKILIVLFLFCLSPAMAQKKQKPNILFIFVDDMGYGDLSCYGRPDYKTPNIDKLAAEGTRFTEAYASAPVCTPSRCGYITGRYPARTAVGLKEPIRYRGHENVGLEPEYPTVASLLKKSGYETGLIGKWHLGYKPEFGPNRHGFDEFFGCLSGGVNYFSHRTPFSKLDLHHNLEDSTDVKGYSTDVFTDKAIEFISKKRDNPFFLSLHYTAPHWPWQGPDDGYVKEPNDTMEGFDLPGSLKIYASMVKNLDDNIGRIMKAVKANHLDENTLIVFTSDNGGEIYSYNWPYSKMKFVLWEGGTRVPAIVRWKGTLPEGKETAQSTINFDWTSTFIALGGAKADPAYPLDGEDLMPVLKGEKPVHERTLYWRTAKNDAVRDGKWKYLRDEDGEYLFDLSVDPGEKVNLKTTYPKIFEDLKGKFQAWNAQMLPLPEPEKKK